MRARWVAAAVILLTGCGFIVNPDRDSLGDEPRACEPEECILCPCPGVSRLGYQICDDDGVFDDCRCSPVPDTRPDDCNRLPVAAGAGG